MIDRNICRSMGTGILAAALAWTGFTGTVYAQNLPPKGAHICEIAALQDPRPEAEFKGRHGFSPKEVCPKW